MHINDNIRKARKLRGLSQEEIAEKLEQSRSSYAEWEKETIPRADILFDIAGILDVKPEDLMTEGWEPAEFSAGQGVKKKKAPSLETIQRDLQDILHHQVWTRAEVRAYGQYQVGRDAQQDEARVAKILLEIGRLVSVHAGDIAKEDIRAGKHI